MANQRMPAAAWRERVAQWRASGASLQAYAHEHGLPAVRLHYWVRRVQREAQSAQLVPVRVQQPVMKASALELHGPSGWAMRFDSQVEPTWLAALLSALR